MSGVGRFKLTDALPKTLSADLGGSGGQGQGQGQGQGKGKGKAKAKSKKAGAGKARGTHEQAAEQVREARESSRARNAEASARGHMVDIGRAGQQAGRQKAK